jgi:hypothetical protein
MQHMAVVIAMGAAATPLEAPLEVVAAVAIAAVVAAAVVAVPLAIAPRDSWWCNPFARKTTSV